MKVYNTLTRQKEEFIPIEDKKVKMYVCGPTVYDFIHIGNARPFVVFDAVRRYFLYKGFEVDYVQNFTDIDDKIINKAIAENVEFTEITKRYIKEAQTDGQGLNVLEPTFAPTVSGNMNEIITMISTLIEKGFAYEVDGTVFFDVAKFDEYCKLSKKNPDDFINGIRIKVDEAKKSSADFVLWKPHKENEPFFESPFGNGRPGWHIECSAMAKKYLGDTIDIHAGGSDLIFPHHENEIAQSECANGKPFANYWLHNGFINIDNEKMSKSKGNFFTVRDILKEYTYEEMRFFILSAHYRSPLNFSKDLMESSRNGLNRIKTCLSNLNFAIENGTASNQAMSFGVNSRNEFEEKMEDDFNTADAISVIFELVSIINNQIKDNADVEILKYLKDELTSLLDILGLLYAEKEVSKDFEEQILALIEERTNAKKDKNFALADEIRQKLLDMNVIIEDTRAGVKWSIKE